MRVKDIPFHDRPRERAWREGISVLSDVEVLAILLRTGRKGKSAVELGHELLVKCEGKPSQLASVLQSRSSHPVGLGKVQQLVLCAAIEWGKRSAFTRGEPQSLDDALAFVFSRIREEETEHLYVIPLDLRNRCMGFPIELNRGSRFGVNVSPQDVLSLVVQQNAARFVMIHNHPSGDVSPSPQDVLLTKQILEGARWVGLDFYDHVIVSRTDSVSFRSKEWLD